MGFAFSHLIFAWLMGKLIEFSKKFELKSYHWFFLLFGAIFPDIDFVLSWLFGIDLHRSFTHSIFMVILGFIVIYFGFSVLKIRQEGFKFGLFFSIGILSHLILDMIFGYPGIRLFWPLDYWVWFFGYLKYHIASTLSDTPRHLLIKKFKLAIVDMGIGVLWISYLFFKGKLKAF